MKNIVIFASGTGSNAENIIRYFNNSDNASATENHTGKDIDDNRVSLVVCNRKEAPVIGRARRLGVPVAIVTRAELNDPGTILPLLRNAGADLIVLAGFLLMIPDFLVREYPERIINIHPSLLPKFGGKGMYGSHVHKAVVEAKESETGITIHHVTPECDGGSHIFQVSIPVLPEDTPEILETKIHALEKKYFPEVIASLLEGMK